MLLKLIFTHLLGLGIVTPMNDKNDDRELYYLYVINDKTEKVFVYEHCYEEEILYYIQTNGNFQYNECFRLVGNEVVDDCRIAANTD